jgi:hypothetical protein
MGLSAASPQPLPATLHAAVEGSHGRVTPTAGPTFAMVLESALRAAAGAAPALRSAPVAMLASGRDAGPALASKSRGRGDKEDELLHATVRQAAHMGPPPGAFTASVLPIASAPPAVAVSAAGVPSAEGRALVSLEELLPALVRRIAWSGDARRGSIRLELGAGTLSGATLFVRAEGEHVHVALHAPPGTDVDGWRARIARRLAARGLDAATVDVQ